MACSLSRETRPLAPSAEDELICNDEARIVLAAVTQLSEEKPRAYEMSMFGELSAAAIAEKPEVPRARPHRMAPLVFQ